MGYFIGFLAASSLGSLFMSKGAVPFTICSVSGVLLFGLSGGMLALAVNGWLG